MKLHELYERLDMADENDGYFKFLDELRDSGKTNMYGATPYLEKRFGLTTKEATRILKLWIEVRSKAE